MPRAPHVPGKRLCVFAVTVLACLTAGASCSSSERGLEVDVVAAPPQSPALTSGARHFSTDEGYEITLTRGYLAIGSVELLPCEASAWHGLRAPFGVSVARAHSMSSPTRLGEPGVIALVSPDADELRLGTLKPPPDDYCSVAIGLAPADDDAAALPSDVDFVGLTLYLEGTYRQGDGPSVELHAESGLEVEAPTTMSRLTLDDASSSPVRLTLNSAGEHWFDGVDFATATSDEVAEHVLQNIHASLTVSER